MLPAEDGAGDDPYSEVAARRYEAADGAPAIMLVIARGNVDDERLQLHRPEGCYPAAGFTLGPIRPITLRATRQVPVGANFFTATRPGTIEHVLYWTRVADRFPRTWLQQDLAVWRARLTGLSPGGVLVRISARVADPAVALAACEAFAVALVQAASGAGKRLLLGRLSAAAASRTA